MIKKCSSEKYRCFCKFAVTGQLYLFPILLPETPDAHVKYVAHSTSCQAWPANFSKRLRSLEPLFKKIAKSHLSAQFFVRVFVLGWYTYFETAQVLFYLCFRENGVETLKICE